MLVQLVVGQFDLLEGDHLLHELLSGERGVRMDVQPAGPGEPVNISDWLRRFLGECFPPISEEEKAALLSEWKDLDLLK